MASDQDFPMEEANPPPSAKNIYKDPDDGRQRFLLELEFEQCLANPTYTHLTCVAVSEMQWHILQTRFQELQKIHEEMDKKLEQRVKDGVMAVLNAIGMFPGHPGQFPAPAPGYFPPLAANFFPVPTPLAPSQYPVVGNYRAPGQNPPPHYQPPGRDHSPDQHHARD
ncbi:hypothetical protein BUALT_Bualt12G0031000 [Buddleja alternifolia]|uniref:Uncharacterized protein n=1 Tax=Buddleja alternifolia TaxID=168488 RepID=A0AAV6WNG5_9LAMI|nr:hypothetical protein BUALT_Bualt12G0031000 [Buddleja alternifolia]